MTIKWWWDKKKWDVWLFFFYYPIGFLIKEVILNLEHTSSRLEDF